MAGATERESQQTPRSATYQDEAYAMFLSDIEKDMLENWKDQIKMSVGDEIPRFGVDSAYGDGGEEMDTEHEDDDVIATLELESNGAATSEEFLLSLSKDKLQERLREAGLSIQGKDKVDMVRRLIGRKDDKGESSTEHFLSTLTTVQLQERLREAGLPVTGQKALLIERLLGNCD